MSRWIPSFAARILAILLAAPLLFVVTVPVSADEGSGEEGPIRVLSFSVTSEFPDGFRIKLQVETEQDITLMAARFTVGQQTTGVFEYIEFEGGELVDGELFWRTNTSGRYIPPGTIITYSFEIQDSEGNALETEPREFIYYDARFEWQEVSEGPVAVAYHGPVKKRAEIILDAIIQTLFNMGPLLGADVNVPIRVTMYNNAKESLDALPPGSPTIRRELITEGQAFVTVGTLLTLGSGRLAEGTASHELTHILTHRAGDGVISNVPAWLDEGLSEYGNLTPSFSYGVALEFAIATDRLIPITQRRRIPGNPEDAIIFYGEASDIVRYMVGRFGARRMRDLMTALKRDVAIDEAIQLVYGRSSIALENEWRDFIGAPAYAPSEIGRAKPTPIPRPTVLVYSLTPQPESATISTSADTPPPEEPVETDTPTSAATATAAPAPDPTPAAEEGGRACSAPLHGGARAVDVSFLGLLVGLAGLGLRRRLF